MNVGFIGTGSMGTILIESFLRTNALRPDQLIAANRTFAKAERLAAVHPGLRAVRSNREAAAGSDILFICVKPKDFKAVIDEIRPCVDPSRILVSITSPVLIRHLEEHLPCKIAKVIPSITNFVNSGATLAIYGSRMEPRDIEVLENLLKHVSTPHVIPESHARVCSDLASCGPAFLAFFIERFVDAAVRCTGIARADACRLAAEMVRGTGLLLTEGGFTFETLRERVSVPGGITAEGLRILALDLEGTFERLIRTTHSKYDEEVNKVESLFFNPQS